MTTQFQSESFDRSPALSQTAWALQELQLYGTRAFQDEVDLRPMPEPERLIDAVSDIFDALVATLGDTRMEPDLEELLWGQVTHTSSSPLRLFCQISGTSSVESPFVISKLSCALRAKATRRTISRSSVSEGCLATVRCRDIIRETFDSSVRAGRSAYEALGIHPFEAEQMAHAFVQQDQAAMIELAGLFDSNVPHSENIPYRERAKELIAQRGAQMSGRGNAFLMRVDRGWSPPTPKDVTQAQEEA